MAETTRAWIRGRDGGAERLLVSPFVVHDPWRTITTGSVPFWTYFPVQESADDLLDRASYDESDVMLFSYGSSRAAWRPRRRGNGRPTGLVAGPTAGSRRFRLPCGLPYVRPLLEGAQIAARGGRRRPPMSVADALAGLAADPRVVVGQ